MKRLICLLLCGAMMLCLFACAAQSEDFVKPIKFYYLRVQLPDQLYHGSEDSVISAETREGQGIYQNTELLLNHYLAGPLSDTHASLFPSGTRLVGWHTEGNTLCITLSDQAAKLTGIDLTLACACLSKTFLELKDYETVRIQAESLPLDSKAYITMDESSLLLLDTTMTGTESDQN